MMASKKSAGGTLADIVKPKQPVHASTEPAAEEPTRPSTIRLSDSLYRQLRQAALAERRAANQIIVEALRNYLDERHPEIEP
jgi:hypothetical protein